MRIIIGADFIPTAQNSDLFKAGNCEEIVGSELMQIMNDADYRIINLEAPLYDHSSPIKKRGPLLKAESACIEAYKELGIDLVTLANNHIMDHGSEGLVSTFDALSESNIAWVGAGQNIEEASKPYIINLNNEKIGIYACCEHEFSIASSDKPGANPVDVFNCLDSIRNLKEICNYVIVLYHGGREYYRYPVPFQQKISRAFIKAGADVVVSQHSHCVGCKEKYRDGTIIYGQGNFLFDLKDDEYWRTGLLIKVDTVFNDIEYIPVCKSGEKVRLANDDEKKSIMELFESNSKEIENEDYVENRFKAEADKYKGYYLRLLHGNSLLDKLLDKAFKRKPYSDASLIDLYDILYCESHLELLKEIVKQ